MNRYKFKGYACKYKNRYRYRTSIDLDKERLSFVPKEEDSLSREESARHRQSMEVMTRVARSCASTIDSPLFQLTRFSSSASCADQVPEP